MIDSNEDQHLLESTKTAIRRTTAAIAQQQSGETLAGYALCTDDALETLLYLAVTKEALRSNSDPDLLFSPTDWPYEVEPGAFDEADRLLREHSRTAEELREHVDRSFATLTRALKELRSEGVFGPDVFLTVLSTDPSDYLEQLETESVKALNPDSLAQQRAEFLAKWQ